MSTSTFIVTELYRHETEGLFVARVSVTPPPDNVPTPDGLACLSVKTIETNPDSTTLDITLVQTNRSDDGPRMPFPWLDGQYGR